MKLVATLTVGMGNPSPAIQQSLVDSKEWEAIHAEGIVEVGGIQGIVVDADTVYPVQGATAQSGIYQGITDENGWYEIDGIPAYSYRFTYSAPGYHITERNATIVAGEWTRLDVMLYDEAGPPPPPPDREFPWLWVGLAAAIAAAVGTYRVLKKD